MPYYPDTDDCYDDSDNGCDNSGWKTVRHRKRKSFHRRPGNGKGYHNQGPNNRPYKPRSRSGTRGPHRPRPMSGNRNRPSSRSQSDFRRRSQSNNRRYNNNNNNNHSNNQSNNYNNFRRRSQSNNRRYNNNNGFNNQSNNFNNNNRKRNNNNYSNNQSNNYNDNRQRNKNYSNNQSNNFNNNRQRNNNHSNNQANNYNNNRQHNNNNRQHKHYRQQNNNNQQRHNNNHDNFIESNNPDFSILVKICYKLYASERQMHNWREIPRSILRTFSQLGESINPVEPTEDFRSEITNILTESMDKVQYSMRSHLLNNMEHYYIEAGLCNPLDRHKVIRVVRRQVLRKFKNTDEDKLDTDLDKILRYIGTNFQPPRQHREEHNPTTRATPTEPVRTTTPETAATLATMMEVTATSPNRSPGGRLYSEVTATSNKRRRVGDTPPPAVQQTERSVSPSAIPDTPPPAVQQTVRIVTPTTITTPSEDTTIRRKFGHKTIHDPRSKLFWKVMPLPETSCLVISDSNLRHLQPELIPEDHQVEVFPGMQLTHASTVLRQLPTSKQLKNIVLAVGTNNRGFTYIGSGEKEVVKLEEAIRSRTEHVLTMGTPINNEWPQAEQVTIGRINARLEKRNALSTYIPPPTSGITFKQDNVHHTDESIVRIWNKMRQYIQQQQKN